MSSEANIIEEIRRYLAGEMTNEEFDHFEERLQQDEELSSLLAEQAVIYAERYKLKSRLEDIHQDWRKSKPSLVKPFFTPLKIAAGLMLLIGLTTIIWLSTSPDPIDNAALYADSFAPYRSTPIARAPGSDDWDQTMLLYQNRKYDEVINRIKGKPAKNYLDQFYLAMCYMDSSHPDFDLAIAHLNVALEEESNYESIIHWYLALAHMGKGETEKAKGYLERQSASPKEYKSREALELLNQLSRD